MRCVLRCGRHDGRVIEAEPNEDQAVYRDGGEVYVLTGERDEHGRHIAKMMWD
jgi:hypothetical protein